MASIGKKAITILTGNLNLGLSYLITTVKHADICRYVLDSCYSTSVAYSVRFILKKTWQLYCYKAMLLRSNVRLHFYLPKWGRRFGFIFFSRLVDFEYKNEHDLIMPFLIKKNIVVL